MKTCQLRRLPFVAIAIATVLSVSGGSSSAATSTLDKIKTVVVIYAENRSFDNLYGLFPGANGISNTTPASYQQLDRDGKTVLMGDDGTNTVLFMFNADKEKDLSVGILYVAEWTQTSATAGGAERAEWIR